MRPLPWRRLLLAAVCLLPLRAFADPFGYAVGFNELYRIDLASGAATRIGAIGFNDVEGLALGPDGVLYGVVDQTMGAGSAATDFLIRIDPVTGAGSLIGQLGLAGQGPGGNLDYGLAFTCDGRLWASSDTTQELWELDRVSGAARRTGNTGVALSGLAANERGLFGISVGANPALYRIDPERAQAVLAGPLNAGGVVDDAGLDFDEIGNLWAVLDPEPAAIGPSRVAQINPVTGQSTVLATVASVVGMEGLAIARTAACADIGPRSVPVNTPLGLLGLGVLLAGLAAARLRSPVAPKRPRRLPGR